MSRIVGYAPGVYDLFHVGHLNILRQARKQCDWLVAGVVSDEMCELAKGQKPFVPFHERTEIVRHIRYVNEVHAEMTPDKLDAWHAVRFNVIFKGDDWRDTPKGRRLEEQLATVGAVVCYFPYTATTSSTMLRRALSTSLDEGRSASR